MDAERNGRRALLNQPGNDYGGTTPCTLSKATFDTSSTSAFGGLYAILKNTSYQDAVLSPPLSMSSRE
jgi:hypothetical protein